MRDSGASLEVERPASDSVITDDDTSSGVMAAANNRELKMQKEIKELRDLNQQLNEENDELAHDVQDLLRDNEEMYHELVASASHLKNLAKLNQEMEAERDQLAESLGEIQKQLKKETEKNSAQKQDKERLTQMTAENAKLKQDLEAAKEEKEDLGRQLTRTKELANAREGKDARSRRTTEARQVPQNAENGTTITETLSSHASSVLSGTKAMFSHEAENQTHPRGTSREESSNVSSSIDHADDSKRRSKRSGATSKSSKLKLSGLFSSKHTPGGSKAGNDDRVGSNGRTKRSSQHASGSRSRSTAAGKESGTASTTNYRRP